MIVSDQQRDENFQEYLRLLNDSNYYDVTFDEKSGGVSAIHKDHQFDKKIGPFGIKRGIYEIKTINALMRLGYSIILEPELSSGSTVCKSFDGYLNGLSTEIKAIESDGRWAIRTKLSKAHKQGATIVVLFFPDKNLFSKERVIQGWKDFETSSNSVGYLSLLCVVEEAVIEIEKPSW